MKKILNFVGVIMIALTACLSLAFFGVEEKVQAFTAVREYSLQNVNDGVILSVEKVYRPVVWEGGEMQYLNNSSPEISSSVANYKKMLIPTGTNTQETALYRDIQNLNAQNNTTSTKTVIRNGGSIMLDDIRTESASVTDVENIMVSFASYNNATVSGAEINNGQSIYVLNVAASLNEQDIQVGIRQTANFDGTSFYDFTMFLDLNNATYASGDKAGELVEDQEGRYDFTFTYQRKVNGVVYGENVVDFSFYVLSKDNYTKQQTLATDVSYYTQPTIRDAFGSNNNYSFGYKSNTGSVEHAEYPKLTLDLKKYGVTFTRMYSEVTEYYEVIYDYNANTATIIKHRLNATTTSEPIQLDYNGLFTIIFTDLGEYNFTYNVKYEDGKVIRDVPKHEIDVDSQKLTIYGYQLKYNRNNNGDNELKYVEFYDDTLTGVFVLSDLQHKLVEDASKMAGTISYVESADISSQGYTISVDGIDSSNYPCEYKPSNLWNNSTFIDKFVVTNQGPVWFDNSAEIELDSAQSRVFYAPNATTNFVMKEFVNGAYYPNITTSVGYYLIKIAYRIEGVLVEQVFAFYVSEESQIVGAYATDSEIRPSGTIDSVTINSEDFTNKNVFVHWEEPGRFENRISATYYYSPTYNTNLAQMTVQNVAIDHKTKLFTQSGSYVIVITYADDPNNTTTIPFIIDKEPISGIQAKGISQIVDSLNNVGYIYNGADYTSLASVDQAFTLLWAEKTSGAEITVEYSFTELKEDVSITPEYRDVNGKGLVNVQYIIGKTPAYALLTGAKSTTTVVSSDYCFAATGFHVFKLTDKAGNQMQYMVFLDGTKASFVQTPAKNNANNIISSDLTVTWGSHKSIPTVASGDESILSKLFGNIYTNGIGNYPNNANLAAFKNYLTLDNDGKYYVNIPLRSVKVISSLYNATENKVTEQTITPQQIITSTQRINIPASLDTEGEYYFGISSASNVEVDGKMALSEHYAIINTDNAQVTMFGYANFELANNDTTDTGLTEAQKTYVSPNRANNYQALKVQWNKGAGEYEVDSITLKYYALDVSDTMSSNYPYAENPLITRVLEGNTYNILDGINQSEVLLSTPISTTSGVVLMSAEGKYEIVRRYVDATKEERTYIYYVDRSDIIEYDSDNECVVGQNISLKAGNKTFKDFQTSPTETLNISIPGRTTAVAAEIILTTNKLPVELFTPDNKFYSSGARKLDAFKMNMNVYYSLDIPNKDGAYIAKQLATFDKVNSPTTLDSYQDFVYSSSDYLQANAGSVNNFKDQGYYIVEISDSTGDWKDIISGKAGNTYTYAFKIKNDKPKGYFYGQERSGTPTSLVNYRYTKDSELSFEIQQPLDEFMARVDEKNITITRSYINSNGNKVEEIYYSATPEPSVGTMYQGVVAHLVSGVDASGNQIDSENNDIITTEYSYTRVDSPISEDFSLYYTAKATGGFDKADEVGSFDSTGSTKYYTRASKVINFNLLPKNVYTYDAVKGTLTSELVTPLDEKGNTYEYTFTVTIRYEGQEQDYITTSTNFYSNTQSMTIDHTPPSDNINALIGANMDILKEYGYVDASGNQTLYEYVQADYNGERYYSYRANDFFAFGVNSNFTLTTAQDATIQSIYYRKLSFDPSSAKASSMQSVLPGDENYYDYTNLEFNDAYRFSNNNSAYSVCGINASVINFYNDILLKDAAMRNADGTFDGYYEIVEMDDAGNTSSFVVLLNTQPTALSVEYTSVDSADLKSVVLDNADNQLTAVSVNLKSINTIERFMTISVRNQTTGQDIYSIRTDETTDMLAVCNAINSLLKDENNFYIIKISNRFGAEYNFMLGLTTSDTFLNEASLKTVIVDGEPRYALDISNMNNGGIRLSRVTLRKVVDQIEQSAIIYDLVYDTEGVYTIYLRGEVAPKTDIVFSKSDENYWFNVYFTDSAGRITDQSFYIGREGDAEFITNGEECYQYGNVYYSTDNVEMTFISGLYTYNISLANSNEDVTRLYAEQVDVINGTTLITMFRPALSTSILGASGGRYVFTINLLSKLNNSKSKTYTVVIDNRLPAINFVNEQNADKNAIASVNTLTPNTSTGENIIVKWDSVADFQTTIFNYQLTMQRFVDGVVVDNINLFAQGTNNSYYISRDKEGTYVVHLGISINGKECVTKYISFTIASSKETMYSVEQLIDGKYVPITSTDTISYKDLGDIIAQATASLPADFATNYNNDMPVELYFVNSDINIVVNGDKGIELVDYNPTVEGKFVLKIHDGEVALTLYQIKSSSNSPYSYEKIFAIINISQGNRLALTDLYLIYGNELLGDPETLTLNASVKAFDKVAPQNIFVIANRHYGNTTQANSKLQKVAEMNHLYMEMYYNNGNDPVLAIDLSDVIANYSDMAMVELNYAGIYSFRIYDKAGNEQLFVNSNGLTFNQYSLTLLTEVVVSVNEGPIVDNAYYNGNVYLDFLSSTLYSKIDYTIYKNGVDYTTIVPRVNYSFTFSESGTYTVTYSAVRVAGSKTYNIPTRTMVFTIINPGESRLALDFTTLYNSYNITKVTRIDASGEKVVTDMFLSILDDHTMVSAQDLVNNAVALGLGQYRVDYVVSNRNNLPDVEISFTFRISNQTASIYSSQVPGETTTKTVTVTFNPYVIYRQLGECTLRITDYMDFEINASTAEISEVQTITISGVGNYYVQLLGVDDSVLSSFLVQIKEPLNTFSIVLIVVVSVVVIGGVATFIILRHRMKVR